MKMDIINLTQYADALRSTGYKNIESAISELVDNSVEAKAKNIFIIIKETEDDGKMKVTEIAFLDNGIGMDKELVQGCLRIGYGTRVARKGIGRFGVGLPQASMHVCPLVEVYSWQDYETPYKAYLDIEKIKSGEQTFIDEPVEENIPEKYQKYLSYQLNDPSLENNDISFKCSGTLVIWRCCDNVTPRRAATLIERLVFELGKKFRYIINDKKSNIHIIDTRNDANPRRVKPNDPLLLMEDNYILGDSAQCMDWIRDDPSFNEPIFMPYEGKNNEYKNGIIEKAIIYRDKKTKEEKESIVKIKLSIVKPEFYDTSSISGLKQPGDGNIGKELKKLEGISIIRAGREVDFGRFDFYSSVNTPVHRWWGCEISFGTELDEVFGVSNNKQHVELIAVKDSDYTDEYIKPVWFQLNEIIKKVITNMVSRNKDLRRGCKSNNNEDKVITSDSVDIINTVSQNNKETNTDKIKEENVDFVKEEAKKILESMDIVNPTESDIQTVLKRKVNFIYIDDKLNNRFFDIEVERGISKCIINKAHIMYENFLNTIENESGLSTCFELFIGSLVRVKDEITDTSERAVFDKIIEDWNEKLTSFLTRFTNS